MIILLSSAKTFAQTFYPFDSAPIFHLEALDITRKLKVMSISKLSKQMKLSDRLADKVFHYYQNFDTQLTCAIFTYDGYAYRAFDVDSFTNDELNYLKDRLYILSGLYGLVRPFDGISFYRLEMQNTSIGNLYQLWGEKLNNYLRQNHKNEYLINLSSIEYSKVIDNTHKLVTISFYELVNSKLKTNSMQIKKMRGLMARYLIKNKIDKLDAIKEIVLEGYCYDKSRSQSDHYLFVKRFV